MKLHDYNIRALVLTVQEMPEKTDFIQGHFKERGIEAENFNCFSAALSGLNTSHLYTVDDPSGWNIGGKAVANWCSQYMLWNAMLYMPESHFLQLEWDAKFPPDWKAATEDALRNTPTDFDLLYIGSCCAQGKESTHHGGKVYTVKWPMCNHATIIAKKALPIMLSTQRKCYAPMDLGMMFHTLDNLKVYTVLPRIVDQFDTFLHP